MSLDSLPGSRTDSRDTYDLRETSGAGLRLTEEFMGSLGTRGRGIPPTRPDLPGERPGDRPTDKTTDSPGDRSARPERPDGMAERGRTSLDGKPITINAERDPSGGILRFQYVNKDGAEILSITKDPRDGKLHVDMAKLATSPEGKKLLQKMGIDASKLPADGTIPGTLELQHGRMKYVDKPDNPTRKITYLREDGSKTEIDGKTYVRTESNAAGAVTSRKGWDGRGWRDIKGEPRVTTDDRTGVTTTRIEFTPGSGKNKSITRVAEDKDGGTNKTTFTKADGRILEYDWKDRTRKDTRTNKVETYDGLGKYVTPDKVSRTLSRDGSGSIEYKSGDTTMKRDKENRVLSMESGTPKKKIEFEYDKYGDVKTFKVDGKQYTREGNDKTGGMAYHLNRSEGGTEANFKRLTAFNTWKVEPGGEKVKFNLGVTENGKLIVGREGRPAKELRPQDLAKLPAELTGRPDSKPEGRRAEVPPAKVLEDARRLRAQIEAPPHAAHLNTAKDKLGAGADRNQSALDTVKGMTDVEKHTLHFYLEARKRDPDSLSKRTDSPATAEAGMRAMRSVSAGDKFAALTPAQAEKLQEALRASGYRPPTRSVPPRK